MNSVVYFLLNGEEVRIGECKDFAKRLKAHQSSRGKGSTKVIALFPVSVKDRKTEETKAFNYFEKYRVPGETKSFYSKEIIDMISDYILDRQLIKQGIEKDVEKRTGTKLTVFGNENLSKFRDWCDIFPHQKVTYMGKAGSIKGETPRTFNIEGKEYKVGSSGKNLIQSIIRDTKKKYYPVVRNKTLKEVEQKLKKNV